MIYIDNEYLLIINNEIFKVYSPNECQAINRFRSGCVAYKTTSNNEFYKEHWQDMINSVDDRKYQITKLDDFLGFRKVI